MRIDDLHKRCAKCGQVKALADFYANAHEPQGVNGYCVPCWKRCNKRRKTVRAAAQQAAEHASERDARRKAEDLREARALLDDLA